MYPDVASSTVVVVVVANYWMYDTVLENNAIASTMKIYGAFFLTSVEVVGWVGLRESVIGAFCVWATHSATEWTNRPVDN